MASEVATSRTGPSVKWPRVAKAAFSPHFSQVVLRDGLGLGIKVLGKSHYAPAQEATTQ
jgi:hypothetical protein